MKLQIYAAAIAASVFLVLVGVLLRQWPFSISIETIEPEAVSVEPSVGNLSATTATVSPLANPAPAPPSTPSTKSQRPSRLSSRPSATGTGNLRVSNQTDYPVRVALLPQQSTGKSNQQSRYGETAHWDFAPGEGASKGLMLSLPDRNLKLQKGDIVVAFAQDGSRRYWGPYVVGETSLPVWNSHTSEWLLILQP